MLLITKDNLGELYSEAMSACDKSIVYDLILSGSFNANETQTAFIRDRMGDVRDWQSKTKPENLYINHGEFIHRHGDAYDFLVRELKQKRDSNRAVISLIDMQTIIKSGDLPIPSFLLLQFGFPGDNFKVLNVSAYFRALEVSNFLPINLAEICYYVDRLRTSFPDIETFGLTLHSFKAYVKKHFHCLKVPQIDLMHGAQIYKIVMDRNKEELKSILASKLAHEESIANSAGIRAVVEAMRVVGGYNALAIESLDAAILHIDRLKSLRENTSHSPQIHSISDQVRLHLEKAITVL